FPGRRRLGHVRFVLGEGSWRGPELPGSWSDDMGVRGMALSLAAGPFSPLAGRRLGEGVPGGALALSVWLFPSKGFGRELGREAAEQDDLGQRAGLRMGAVRRIRTCPVSTWCGYSAGDWTGR